MKVSHILYVTFILFVGNTQAQSNRDSVKRCIFLELGGSGGLASVNYEKSFWRRNSLRLDWRVGFSMAPIDRNNGTGLVFPVMVHASFGKHSSKLEFAAGQGITVTTKLSAFFLTTLAMCYRHESNKSKWVYRIAYTPLVSYLVHYQWQHWGGISIGYCLNARKK